MISVRSSSIPSFTVIQRKRRAAHAISCTTRVGLPRPSALLAFLAWPGITALLLLAWTSPAQADLKLCNNGQSRIGVAIGYEDKSGWATEGWWNIPGQSCETILRGPPPSRYLYFYAIDYDRGGEWTGASFMCVGDKSFRIRDTKDCEQRGHKRMGFMEVDTGGERDWTVRFGEPE